MLRLHVDAAKLRISIACGAVLFLLSGCSETLIGKEPGNMKVVAAAGSPDSPDIESSNWMRDVPKCKRNIGVIALLEQESEFPGNGMQQNAVSLLRYLIQRSGCFTVVDRGAAIAKLDAERGYSENPGRPQYRRMDYLLSARVIFQETLANDTGFNLSRSITRAPADSIGFGAGVSVAVRKTEANVLLLLTDVRSSLQLRAEQGSATKLDTTMSAYSSWGMESSSAKTVSAALFDAYARLVRGLNETDLERRKSPK